MPSLHSNPTCLSGERPYCRKGGHVDGKCNKLFLKALTMLLWHGVHVALTDDLLPLR